MPTLLVVAGPNGCGKSTLTRTTWFGDVDIIDPDAIARGMTADGPGQAAREALRRRRPDAYRGNHPRRIGHSSPHGRRAAGRLPGRPAHVSVISPDRALDRIRNRVALGGHDVPETDARRRFVRSHASLPAAIALAHEAMLYDNTDPDRPHREVAILRDAAWWVAQAVPGWAAVTLARTGLPHRRR